MPVLCFTSLAQDSLLRNRYAGITCDRADEAIIGKRVYRVKEFFVKCSCTELFPHFTWI